MTIMKVSCITPTYRRFNCIERSITFFLSQKTTIQKELIILNTDTDYPLELDNTFTDQEKDQIKIINNNTDYVTGTDYNCTGAIRRDAFSHATGEYYITWDDDDIFLPWNIQQCVDGINKSNKGAWKPYYSFMWFRNRSCEWTDYRTTAIPKLQHHFLEASAIVKSEHVSFLLESGRENFGWYQPLIDSDNFANSMRIDDLSIPGYCFNWADDTIIGGQQKQSGGFNVRDNIKKFQTHKQLNTDKATRKLTRKKLSDYSIILESCNKALQSLDSIHQPLIEKYIGSYDYFKS